MRRSPFLLPWLLLALCGCSGTGSNDELSQPSWMSGIVAEPGQHAEVPMPNQVAGGNPRDPGLRSRRTQQQTPTLSPQDQEALLARRRTAADALWQQAEATRDHESRADTYKRIGDDYPEVPRAAEARFREGQARVLEGDLVRANEVLMEYMAIAPVNPHAAEVEELIYRASTRDLRERSGLLAIFRTDENGLRGLEYIPRAFPAGNYPDDALLALARYHRDDGDPSTAALNYKELLRRYPDSEWSFVTRLELANTYMSRDTGDPYRAGFVERDPRERVPNDPIAQAHAGPVKSALELAIEQYELFQERIALDPGRRAEYASQVAFAASQIRVARTRLAAKDRSVAAWYAARGDGAAAAAYQRSAEQWLQPGGRPTPVNVSPPPASPTAPPLAAPTLPPAGTGPAPQPPQGLPPPPPPPPRASAPTQPGSGPSSGATTPPRGYVVPPPPPPPAWPPGN